MFSKFMGPASRLIAFWALVLALGAPLAAQAQGVVAQTPGVAAQAPGVAPTPQPATSAPAAVVSNDYRLGPGDKIRVIVFGEAGLSGEFIVSGTGVVSFPLIGEVNASSVSLENFRLDLQKKLAAGYLKDPRVSVEVLTYRPFYILGEVTRPGEYAYSSGLTILKAVATAGGFTYRAQTKRVYIRHLSDPTEALVQVTTDTQVQPGDTIRVAERFF